MKTRVLSVSLAVVLASSLLIAQPATAFTVFAVMQDSFAVMTPV